MKEPITVTEVDCNSHLMVLNSSSKSSSKRVYDGKKDDTNHTYESITLFDAIEFDKTQSHSLKLTIQDPTANTNANFRLMLDYLLFEPVN